MYLVLGLGTLTFAQDIAFLIYDPFRNSLAPWLAIIIFQGERANKRCALIYKESLEKERDERQKWTGKESNSNKPGLNMLQTIKFWVVKLGS